MSDDKNDFAARLARIEAKREQQAPKVQPRRPQADPDGIARQRPASSNGHRLRNGLIWAAILAVFATGGWFGTTSLVKSERLSAESLSTGFSDLASGIFGPVSLTGKKTAPAAPRVLRDRGYVVQAPLVLTADNADMTVEQVLASFAPMGPTTAPRSIIAMETNTACTLRRPRPQEKVTNIRLDFGVTDAPVQIFSQENLAEAVLKNVRGHVERHRPEYLREARVGGQMRSVDVVLTDTSAPLYLVLQTLGDDVIWNLHPADGVQIAHIAMIGDDSGVVALPRMPTVEALRVSDFVTKHQYGEDDEIRECMIRPWRLPQPHWRASQLAQSENMLMVNQVYTYNMGHAAFDHWYQQTLGVSAQTNIVAGEGAAVVLAGPVPATPVDYQSMTGRDIHMTHNDYMIAGTPEARAAAVDRLQTDIMTAAAGGDLAYLTPAPMGDLP